MLKHFFLFIILIFSFSKVFSQNVINGRVLDSKLNPLYSANILTYDVASGKVLSIELSDKEGFFTLRFPVIKGLELRVRIAGFQEQIIKVSDTNYQDVIIKMIEKINELKEVTVIAKKPLIERKIDRLVFNVENNISTIGSDAFEVLSKAPGIRMEETGLNIIGRSNVRLMINSKMVNLSGATLINYLRSINAEEIKEIEIITIPSAKYEAAGNSGLVNIVLKKNNVLGYNGSINTGILLGKYMTTGLTGLFNYNINKLHINSNLTGSLGKNYSYVNGIFNRPEYNTEDLYSNVSKRKSFRGSVSIDYDLTKSTSAGIKFEQVNSGVDNNNDRKVIFSSSSIDSIILTPGFTEIGYDNTSVYVYLQHKIDTTGKMVDFDASYINYGNNSNGGLNSNTFRPELFEPINSGYLNSLSNQSINIFSSKVDFTIPTTAADLEYGGKASFIKSSSINEYNTSLFPLGSQFNNFNYIERLFALYLSAEKKIGSWELKIGLRAEHTNTLLRANNESSTYKRSYTNLFPTAYLNYNIDESKTLGISYGKRINRPYYDFLNPARIYTSKYNYEEGNPNLLPSFTHNFELNFNTKNFQTSLYSSILRNGFSFLTILDSESALSIQTPLNYLDFYQYGISQSYSFNKLKWLESNNQMNIYFEKDKFNSNLVSQQRSYFSAFVSTDNTFLLNKKKTLRANLRFYYQFPEIYDFDRRNAYYGLNIGLSANLLKRKLSVAINGTDILKTGNIVSGGIVNNVRRQFEYYSDNRNFKLSFIYRFGTNKNNKRFRDSSIEESERIKN